jgi:hypothetical protein
MGSGPDKHSGPEYGIDDSRRARAAASWRRRFVPSIRRFYSSQAKNNCAAPGLSGAGRCAIVPPELIKRECERADQDVPVRHDFGHDDVECPRRTGRSMCCVPRALCCRGAGGSLATSAGVQLNAATGAGRSRVRDRPRGLDPDHSFRARVLEWRCNHMPFPHSRQRKNNNRLRERLACAEDVRARQVVDEKGSARVDRSLCTIHWPAIGTVSGAGARGAAVAALEGRRAAPRAPVVRCTCIRCGPTSRPGAATATKRTCSCSHVRAQRPGRSAGHALEEMERRRPLAYEAFEGETP